MKIQDIYKILGESGCYYFCLCDIANEVNNRESYLENMSHVEDYVSTWKYCYLMGWIGKDCFIKDPCAILKYMTGKTWSVSWEDWQYEKKEGDFVVECRKWGMSTHFTRLIDTDFNSLESSRCVTVGQIDSYRIFRVL